MGFLDFLGNKKRKQEETEKREQEAANLAQRFKQAVDLQDEQLKDTKKTNENNTELGKEYLQIAKETTAIGKSLDSKSEQLITLVKDNEKVRNSLIQREVGLREKESDLDERRKEVRKSEIEITARKSDVRRLESDVSQRDKKLDEERAGIKERESTAKKLASDSRAAKENYDAERKKLEERKDLLDEQEEKIRVRLQELNARQENADAIFKKAEEVDKEMAEKERVFEEKRTEIEGKLKTKIEEYERKIADMESVKGTVESVKFDSSEEGNNAKIVVQEAIRQAKINLEDNAKKFGDLQEKYCEGTFLGFSILLVELDDEFKTLKDYKKQIEKYFDDVGLRDEMAEIIKTINSHIVDADKSRKSWDFPEAYRSILKGLTTCKNCELLVQIYAELNGTGSSYEEDGAQSDKEPDYYEILGVSPNSSEKEIRDAYRKMRSQWHSDRKPENEKEEYDEKMKQINKAKTVLLDERQRKEYDDRRQKQGD